MLRKELYYYISPDFVNEYRSLLSMNERDTVLLVPVFYNDKFTLGFDYYGKPHSLLGNVYDLMSDLKSRFFPFAHSIIKYKCSDLFNLYNSCRYNIISPITKDLFCSGFFKFFMVVYLK